MSGPVTNTGLRLNFRAVQRGTAEFAKAFPRGKAVLVAGLGLVPSTYVLGRLPCYGKDCSENIRSNWLITSIPGFYAPIHSGPTCKVSLLTESCET